MPTHQPDRDKLGPMGPAKAPADQKRSREEKHPNPGTVQEQAGPSPTDDPSQNRRHAEQKIEEARTKTPPD